MAVKLYYAPKTRSTRPRWLLEEMGVPYEVVRINMAEKQHKSPEYKKVHPLGLLPAMELDGVKFYESTALVGALADKFPEKKMAPAPGTKERAIWWQWVQFATATVERNVIDFWHHTSRNAEGKRHADVAEDAKANWEAACEVLDKALDGKDFLVGDAFTAADVLTFSVLNFGKSVGLPIAPYVHLVTYLEKIKVRPAFRKAIAD